MKYKKILGPKLYDILYKIYVSWGLKHTISCIHKNNGKFTAVSAVDFLFSKDAKLIKPMQIREEILELARRIEKKRPSVILEIGTARGGTLFLASQLAADDALIISIDLPGGMYGGGYPDWKIPFYKAFKKKNQVIELIQGDSHSDEVLMKLKILLNKRTIDYLFIDGDHTYEGVKKDFDTYSRLLSPGSFVAFHDIVSDKSPVPDHFVHRFWEEIKIKHSSTEIIKDRNQSKLGIGILQMN